MTNSLNPLDRGQILSRRGLLMGAAVLATIGVGASMLYSLLRAPPRADAEGKKRPIRRSPGTVTTEELMKPGPLPELTVGQADAPVTIVEYASMTCPACANFHNKVLPVLKEKYIDAGKVRLVFREFPVDPRAAMASMLARCASGDKSLPLIAALFSKQDDWAKAPSEEVFSSKLLAFAQQVGFTKQTFERCSKNEKLIRDIIAVRDRAHQSFGVSATPTFFVNGKKLEGGSVEDFEKVIAPLIKG